MQSAEVLVLGLRDVSIEKHLSNAKAFGLNAETISVQRLGSLPSDQEMESMAAPVVVILSAALESSTRDLELIRKNWHYTSVIVCAERRDMPSVHQLLARGAADFLELPLDTDELMQRVCARVGAFHYRSRESTRQLGALTINMMQRTVSNGKDTAFLTPIETKIVATLAESVGGVVERNAMKQMCWGDMSITDNALNRKIYEVRRTLRKLSEDINIRTIYGLGFELEMQDRPRA